ncbi:MAG: alpha/beta hydrolase [Streptosporangiales bacterium]|jgi:pimeloyl-ACP methyl ester carboxylesterase|nr:alpha/beta hydrolase [Streptosporangiales bacterium]
MDGISAMVRVGEHQIEANVFGAGSPAVVVEPALGGDARAWQSFAEELGEQTTVVTYNRVPYGASSTAADERKPEDVARDLHGLLTGLKIGAPVVLIGHSIGGIFVRAYAAAYADEVAGMVLVESSHEDQRRATRGKTPWKWLVMDFFTIPDIMFGPPGARRGGDRRSLIREFRAFRKLTADDRLLFPGDLGSRPLIVVTRRRDDTISDRGFWPVWHELHEDLARLSSNSRHVVSRSPGHHLNEDDPRLILAAAGQVVRSVRTSEPLASIAQDGSALIAGPASAGLSDGGRWN